MTELCPVGALTSTQYRFEARPWEITNVPTVCGLCPVGCNINATVREGKVKRVLSRNHPEIDEGWLCDKGRFGSAISTRRSHPTPLRRPVHAGSSRSLGRRARRGRGLLRRGGESTVTALSGGESVEEAYALAKLMRQGLHAHNAVLPRSSPTSPAAPPLLALREAKTIAVLCDVPVVERAPIVDLWLKAARRAGATIAYERPKGAVDALVTDDAENAAGDRRDARLLPAADAERPRRRRRVERRRRRRAGRRGAARLLVISGDEAALNETSARWPPKPTS